MKTIVNFILDKSGSMESVREATISGFNEYIQTLKKDKKSEYEFSLTLFDTTSQTSDATDIKKVKELTKATYEPNGNTALYDAVCSSIKGLKPTKKQKALVIIMTDGEENSSKEYTQVEMKKMIEEREATGNWSFVYLGANQDSYAAAQKYGIQASNTANFFATSTGAKGVFRGMSTATMAYATGDSGNNVLASVKEDIENTK